MGLFQRGLLTLLRGFIDIHFSYPIFFTRKLFSISLKLVPRTHG